MNRKCIGGELRSTESVRRPGADNFDHSQEDMCSIAERRGNGEMGESKNTLKENGPSQLLPRNIK